MCWACHICLARSVCGLLVVVIPSWRHWFNVYVKLSSGSCNCRNNLLWSLTSIDLIHNVILSGFKWIGTRQCFNVTKSDNVETVVSAWICSFWFDKSARLQTVWEIKIWTRGVTKSLPIQERSNWIKRNLFDCEKETICTSLLQYIGDYCSMRHSLKMKHWHITVINGIQITQYQRENIHLYILIVI